MAANLHLVIGPSEILHHAVGPPSREIAGAIHPTPGMKRIGQETIRGQGGLPQILARHAVAGDVQLTGRADRRRVEMAVEHIDAHVGRRPADRDRCRSIAGRIEAVDHAADRRFGRAVFVEDLERTLRRINRAAAKLGLQVLASEDQPANPPAREIEIADHREVRRRQLHDVDDLIAHHLKDCRQRRLVAVDDDPSAGEERKIERGDRQVEGDRRKEGKIDRPSRAVGSAAPTRHSSAAGDARSRPLWACRWSPRCRSRRPHRTGGARRCRCSGASTQSSAVIVETLHGTRPSVLRSVIAATTQASSSMNARRLAGTRGSIGR